MPNHMEAEVLLVEDTPEDAELMIRALRKGGFANRLHHVEDGAAALDFLFARGAYADRDVSDLPKVLLLDLKLPKVDGLEVLRELRADGRTRSLPVVMITSSREDRDLQEAYRIGANSYVVKPVDFQQFVDAMTSVGMFWLLVNQVPDRAAR
jgi:two-component system response regulator